MNRVNSLTDQDDMGRGASGFRLVSHSELDLAFTCIHFLQQIFTSENIQ